MKKIDWKDLIISILVPVGLGFIVGLITKDFNDFATLNKPFFAPPASFSQLLGLLFIFLWEFLIMALVMPRKVILMRYNFF